MKKFSLITKIGDKFGTIGAVVATMGCVMCFPALAGIGAALGMGFLSQWEGLFITTLLPIFAGIALLSNALGWLAHRQWHRSLIGSGSASFAAAIRAPELGKTVAMIEGATIITPVNGLPSVQLPRLILSASSALCSPSMSSFMK